MDLSPESQLFTVKRESEVPTVLPMWIGWSTSLTLTSPWWHALAATHSHEPTVARSVSPAWRSPMPWFRCWRRWQRRRAVLGSLPRLKSSSWFRMAATWSPSKNLFDSALLQNKITTWVKRWLRGFPLISPFPIFSPKKRLVQEANPLKAWVYFFCDFLGRGSVVGCEYRKAGKVIKEFGPMVLASGGFGADFGSDSLLATYRPDLLHLPTTNGEHCTGDAIKMGEASFMMFFFFFSFFFFKIGCLGFACPFSNSAAGGQLNWLQIILFRLFGFTHWAPCCLVCFNVFTPQGQQGTRGQAKQHWGS